ncbi:MAG: hypothetical protein ACLFUL_11860 [Desulfobacteraceae bacterium]
MDTLIIILIALLATGYLLRRFGCALKGKQASCGCGTCGGCGWSQMLCQGKPPPFAHDAKERANHMKGNKKEQ